MEFQIREKNREIKKLKTKKRGWGKREGKMVINAASFPSLSRWISTLSQSVDLHP